MMGFGDSSGISWTVCKQSTSLQTDNHTNTSSLNFYSPDALPDAQPTVSNTEGMLPSLLYTHTRLTALFLALPG